MRLGHGVGAHRLGNAGNLAVAHLARGFGRDIRERKAAASASQDDIGAGIAAGNDGVCDHVDVVFHDNARKRRPPLLGNELLEARSCRILLDIACG